MISDYPRKKYCTDGNLNLSKNQYSIPAFLFVLRQPTSSPLQQLNKKIDSNQLHKNYLPLPSHSYLKTLLLYKARAIFRTNTCYVPR